MRLSLDERTTQTHRLERWTDQFSFRFRLHRTRNRWINSVQNLLDVAHARLNESLPETTRSSRLKLKICSKWNENEFCMSCVCVCVREREKERGWERGRWRERERGLKHFYFITNYLLHKFTIIAIHIKLNLTLKNNWPSKTTHKISLKHQKSQKKH